MSIVRTLLIAYLLVCFAAWCFQSKLVWFPGGPPALTPDAAGLSWRDVALATSDGETLRAWWIPAERSRGAVLFCHGNAGSIEHRLGAAQALVRLGVSVLLFDYRGYGGSTGAPSEAGTYLDAEAAWDHLANVEQVAPQRIVAWGESLGGAVAIELARRRRVGALVTESTFTSIADVAAVHYRWLPVRWLLRIDYDNLAKAGELRLPWLLLHSEGDEVVPFSHARRLYESAQAARRDGGASAAPVELVRTRAGHNDGGFLNDPAAASALAHFLERCLPP